MDRFDLIKTGTNYKILRNDVIVIESFRVIDHEAITDFSSLRLIERFNISRRQLAYS